MQNDAGNHKQRAVIAYQHQPAAIADLDRYGITAVARQVRIIGVQAAVQFVNLAVQPQVCW
ncbi:hypothetical protein D3C77_693160 [compost metagenome]